MVQAHLQALLMQTLLGIVCTLQNSHSVLLLFVSFSVYFDVSDKSGLYGPSIIYLAYLHPDFNFSFLAIISYL